MSVTQKVYADQSVSVSDLKANPNSVFTEASKGAVAVLSHNKPKAYILSEKQYVGMVDAMEKLLKGEAVQKNDVAKFRPTRARLEEIAQLGSDLLLTASSEKLGQFSE